MVYDKLFITNLPSFYKINLYNEICKKQKILVVFTGDGGKDRNEDFFKGNMAFPFLFYEQRNFIYRLFFTFKIFLSIKYQELVLGGWDSLPLWLFAFLSRKKMNSVVIESSLFESKIQNFRGYIKRIFIARIGKRAYVSGESQKSLALKLGFKGMIIKTKGVGIFNYIDQPKFCRRLEVKNFLYVGRLVKVKNLELLIRVFNDLPFLNLNIIGFGEEENYLKSIAQKNIHFEGAIDNNDLVKYYQKNDVFILPSKSEPWGLVVEEALNNGLPVLVSNMVGCAPEIVNSSNGLIFKYDSENDLKEKISRITDVDFYNFLRNNISFMNFSEIEKEQVYSYL